MRVVLVVNSHVCFDFRKLKKVDLRCFVKLQKEFTHRNPKFYKTQSMGYATKGIPRKIRSYTMGKQEIRFSRGGLRRIKKILRAHGHKITIHDERLSFPPVAFNSKIKLREEQAPATARIKVKQQGLIRGPCSAGKTVTLLQAVAEAKQPACIVVWDTNQQKQWLSEATAKHLLNMPLGQIGGVGGVFKKRKFGKLNICMQQSLWRPDNRDFFAERCGFLGCDEVQRYAARTFQDSINHFPAKYRIGVSASEKRKDGLQTLIYDSFGSVIHEIQDKNVGSRLPAKISLVPTEFKSEQYEWNNNWTDLMNDMAEDKERNKLILKCVRSRSLEKGKVTLILTERRSHALFLRFALKDHYETGMLLGNIPSKDIRLSGWPKHWQEYVKAMDNDAEFMRVKNLGEQKKLNVIIATQKGDVGINIRTIDHVHIVTPTGSDIERFKQQKGRVERDYDEKLREKFGHKSTPRVYYYWDVNMDRFRDAGNKIIKTLPGVSVLKLK